VRSDELFCGYVVPFHWSSVPRRAAEDRLSFEPLVAFPTVSVVAVVSLILFLLGLVLGVSAMLHGTERPVTPTVAPHERRSEHDPASEPSPVANRASLAALAFAFGLSGYLLDSYLTWPWWGEVLAAVAIGGAAFALQSLLIARWAIPSARADEPDPRYLLQGTLARVTRTADGEKAGELVYDLDGHQCTLPVRSLDGSALPLGTDVVIDRVDAGVAFAEPWAAVEQRL